MSITNLDAKEALKSVQGAREIASPNRGFLQQLQEFEGRRLREVRRCCPHVAAVLMTLLLLLLHVIISLPLSLRSMSCFPFTHTSRPRTLTFLFSTLNPVFHFNLRNQSSFPLITSCTLITSIGYDFDRSCFLRCLTRSSPFSFPFLHNSHPVLVHQEQKRLSDKFGQLCLPGDEEEARRMIQVQQERMKKEMPY